MNLPPSADILRKRIEAAKDRGLVKVKKAVDGTIDRFNIHLEALVKTPESYTSHTIFSEEMPLWAYHKGNYNEYLNIIRNLLVPLGYRVEQSHDGGGTYATVVIRWDVAVSARGANMLNPYGTDKYPEPMVKDAKLLRG